MLDHIVVTVADLARSKSFYQATLAAIGGKMLRETATMVGFGETAPDFWLRLAQSADRFGPAHIAFRVQTHALVDAFYNAALQAGGRDFGAPGLRPQYHRNYYGAFVVDPDGNNIEAVCHTRPA